MALIDELNDLVNQIGSSCCEDSTPCSCCTTPCCPPCTFPYAQVTMTCPPPVLAPTRPEPVKPLGLFCPTPPPPPLLTQREREVMRYDNFYNNYNLDWHPESPRYRNRGKSYVCTPEKQRGTTVDGQSPCCDRCIPLECDGCPTGFKPCTMKLCPPPCCDPCGVWCAEIQPCPPKPRPNNQFAVGQALHKDKCKNG